MTITYPLALPASLKFAGIRIVPTAVVAVGRSPYTLQGQAYAHQGQLWQGQFSLPPKVRGDAEEFIAWLMSLNGREGTFLMGIEGCETPRGIATGTPLVNDPGATGRVLVTDGWTPSTTGIIKAGDYFQLGTGVNAHLHKVLQNADSDIGGNATLDIWPRLRVSPNNNDPLVVNNPVGHWRMASNDMGWNIGPAIRFDSMAFDAIEAI